MERKGKKFTCKYSCTEREVLFQGNSGYDNSIYIHAYINCRLQLTDSQFMESEPNFKHKYELVDIFNNAGDMSYEYFQI